MAESRLGEGDLNVSHTAGNEAGHRAKTTIIVVFVAFCPRAVDVIMHDHVPPSAGRTRASRLDPGDAR